MVNNVLDHSKRVKIPGENQNIPGHMVARNSIIYRLFYLFFFFFEKKSVKHVF
jgi:hypothetical protein